MLSIFSPKSSPSEGAYGLLAAIKMGHGARHSLGGNATRHRGLVMAWLTVEAMLCHGARLQRLVIRLKRAQETSCSVSPAGPCAFTMSLSSIPELGLVNYSQWVRSTICEWFLHF